MIVTVNIYFQKETATRLAAPFVILSSQAPLCLFPSDTHDRRIELKHLLPFEEDRKAKGRNARGNLAKKIPKVNKRKMEEKEQSTLPQLLNRDNAQDRSS